MSIAALILPAVYGAAFIIASLLGLIKTGAVHQVFMILTASLAASHLYGLTYLMIYGDTEGITVGDYTRVCATLFLYPQL